MQKRQILHLDKMYLEQLLHQSRSFQTKHQHLQNPQPLPPPHPQIPQLAQKKQPAGKIPAKL